MKKTKLNDKQVQEYAVFQNYLSLDMCEVDKDDDESNLIIGIETKIGNCHYPMIKLKVLDDTFKIRYDELLALKTLLCSQDFEHMQNVIEEELQVHKEELQKKTSTREYLQKVLDTKDLSEKEKQLIRDTRDIISCL